MLMKLTRENKPNKDDLSALQTAESNLEKELENFRTVLDVNTFRVCNDSTLDKIVKLAEAELELAKELISYAQSEDPSKDSTKYAAACKEVEDAVNLLSGSLNSASSNSSLILVSYETGANPIAVDVYI